MTLVLPDVDLDEMLSLDIPCEGLLAAPSGERLPCSNAAEWRRVWNHDCSVVPRHAFKCDDCYGRVYRCWQGPLQYFGWVSCFWCAFTTNDPLEFSRYVRL